MEAETGSCLIRKEFHCNRGAHQTMEWRVGSADMDRTKPHTGNLVGITLNQTKRRTIIV